MRRYSYGINSVHKTAHINIEFGKWYIFLFLDLIERFCFIIPPLPLPPLPLKLRDGDSIEFNDGEQWTTLRNWCGDLRSTFCVMVHMPIVDYCYRKLKMKFVSIDYNKAKEIFYEFDKKFWDEQESLK